MGGRAVLFEGAVGEAPVTEGVKYAGSKLRLLPAILALMRETGARSVLDGFAGSLRVTQALAKSGYDVVCNDVAVWSEVFGRCYLLADKSEAHYRELVAYLNAVPPEDGWFSARYGGLPNGGCAVQSDGFKRPWQIHNTRKLDGIRREIDRLRLDEEDRAVALSSLMLAMDRVDNTLGHYVSYLAAWSPRAYGHMRLEVPRFAGGGRRHEVRRGDVFDAVREVEVDAVYFDPPYGSANDKMPPSRVRYASYYHVWTTVCLNDAPAVVGRAGRRADARDAVAGSVFEEFRRDADGRFVAARALEELMARTRARWVLLSYGSAGRAAAAEVDAIIRRHGRLRRVLRLEYRRHVMAAMSWTREWVNEVGAPNREFLFLVER